MMIFYTGADSLNAAQIDPSRSLGGYLSGTTIPNGRLNSLLSDETYNDYKKGFVVTKGIVLKNTSGADKTGVTIGVKFDNTLLSIQLALVNLNSAGRMEAINSQHDLPYIGTFANCRITDTTDDSLIIGSFVNGATLGIWLKVQLTKQTVPSCSEIEDSDINDLTRQIEIIVKYT